MWLFNKGAFGVALVIMSLAASMLFGVVINVDSETVQKDVPEYVSDIRGLYEGESDQTYVDYNPAANFNGYVLGDTEFTYPNSGTRSVQTINPSVVGSTYIEYGRAPLYADNDIYYITTSNTVTLQHLNGFITGTEFGPFVRASATTWVWGTITVDTTHFRLVGNSESQYTVQYKHVAQLPNVTTYSPSYYEYTLPVNSVAKIVQSGTGPTAGITYIPVSVTPTTLRMEKASGGTVSATINGVTYSNNPTVSVAIADEWLYYYNVEYLSVQWHMSSVPMDVLDTIQNTVTAQDLISLIESKETENATEYGAIFINGNVTASDGTNSYIGQRTFFKTSNGWVGDIGDMEDFTYTASAGGNWVGGYKYLNRWIGNAQGEKHNLEIITSTPASIRVSTGDGTTQTYTYMYILPQNGSITVSTEIANKLYINDSEIMDLDPYTYLGFCPASLSTYDVNEINYVLRATALYEYNSSTRQGYPINESVIAYGNGIPDDQPYGFYKIVASETATLRDESGSMSGGSFGPYYANSDTTWKWGSRTASTTQFSVAGDEDTEYTVTSIGFTQIVIPYTYDMTVPVSNTVVKISSGGASTYMHFTAAFHILRNGTNYTVNGTNYTNVNALYVATFDNVELTYTADIKDFPVDFRPSLTANNYKFSYEVESISSRTGNITAYNYTSENNIENIYPYEGKHIFAVEPYDGVTPTSSREFGEYNNGWTGYFREIPLKTLVDQEILYANSNHPFTTEITIDFPMTGHTMYIPYTIQGRTWTSAYNIVDNPVAIATDVSQIRAYPYTYSNLPASGVTIHQGIVYNTQTKLGYTYYGDERFTFDESSIDTLKVYYPYILQGSQSNPIPVEYQDVPAVRMNRTAVSRVYSMDYAGEDNYDITLPRAYWECTNAMTISYRSAETSAFLDPRFGVNVRNGEQITWQNNYSNEIIEYTTLLGSRDSSGNVFPDLGKNYNTTWEFTYGNSAPSETTIASRTSIQMIHQANGPTTFYFDNYGSGGASYEFGSSWVGFVINVNGATGKVTIAPISLVNWTSFLVNTPESPIPMDYTLRNKGDITGMLISAPGDMTGGSYTYTPVRFQVSNTKVFLNTYGVIKVDATLDILKYYPLNEKFMITIHDTAAVGSSITIAGQSYEVVENRINVPVTSSTGITYTPIDVSEMEIRYYKQNNGLYDMNISSLKTKTDVDITNVADTTIGLEGAWYFESDYYKIVLKDVEEYQWDLYNLAYGYSGVILFMMIFLGILGILAWKLLPDMVGAIDIVIIIVAEIILFIILA